MHVGQQQGIDNACKSTPFQSLQAICLLACLSSRLHLNMIVFIFIYLCMNREAWWKEFVCNWTAVVTLILYLKGIL